MSQTKKKKDTKDSKQNKSDPTTIKENEHDTKIATLTFSETTLQSQLTEQRKNYNLLKSNTDKFTQQFMKFVLSIGDP